MTVKKTTVPEHPIVTVPSVTRLLSTSKPTASILAEVGERKRDRL